MSLIPTLECDPNGDRADIYRHSLLNQEMQSFRASSRTEDTEAPSSSSQLYGTKPSPDEKTVPERHTPQSGGRRKKIAQAVVERHRKDEDSDSEELSTSSIKNKRTSYHSPAAIQYNGSLSGTLSSSKISVKVASGSPSLSGDEVKGKCNCKKSKCLKL
jgi:hypothetical protein